MSGISNGDGTNKTERLSRTAIGTLASRAAGASLGPAHTLLLYHRQGTALVPLSNGCSLTVGRDSPADVVVADPSLSRQHAVIQRDGDQTWVEDLGSTNGCWVGTQRFERREVAVGETFLLGTVTAVVLSDATAWMAHDGVESHERFLRELANELDRCRAHQRHASLMMVRSGDDPAERVDSWLPAARSVLRSYDRLGWYSPSTVEVLLAECDQNTAQNFAWLMTSGKSSALDVGIATFPEHGATAEELVDRVLQALRGCSGRKRVSIAGGPDPADVGADPIVQSRGMVELFDMIGRVATASVSVLVLGETGSGKEEVARSIHRASPRAEGPLTCVNCACIPPHLVESTLFGHEKGAFTGAVQQARGVFEAASTGTVFLDEVAELSLSAQASLLRVLETKRIVRVGSTKELEVDVRVVAATHRDLEAMVRDKLFRQDLFYRLNAFTLRVPPLRERVEEIAALCSRFVALATRAAGKPALAIHDEAMRLLIAYPWPGNVRELRNAIERAVVLCRGAAIEVDDLPDPVRAACAANPPNDASAEVASESPTGEINLRAEMARHEAQLLTRALREADWDRTRAAQSLGVPLRTLSYRMQVLGVRRGG